MVTVTIFSVEFSSLDIYYLLEELSELIFPREVNIIFDLYVICTLIGLCICHAIVINFLLYIINFRLHKL